MSDEADRLYRPLSGLEPWEAAPVDEGPWDDAVERLREACEEDRAWGAMVGRGALLAAAYRSGALDGMHDGDAALRLLRGELSLGSIDEATRTHVRANTEALRLAWVAEVSEHSIRRVHEAACRPQLTHPVRVDDRMQDHVLAAGDYKHHPNHVRETTGRWHATAPVSQVEHEVARLVETAAGSAFSDLHPVAQAAYLHHALLHVRPFADGNGRVARALASGCLMRAASIPLVPFADRSSGNPAEEVDLMQRAGVALIDVLTAVPRESQALDRWRVQEAAGDAVRRELVPAVALALDRYSRRPDRRADLAVTQVVPGETVVIRVERPTLDEVITVEAHPEEGGGPVQLTAAEAELRLDASPDSDLGPWLDRVVSILALRVAAELE